MDAFGEMLCFSCNAVTSKYFRTHVLWCPACLKLTNAERLKKMIKSDIAAALAKGNYLYGEERLVSVSSDSVLYKK
jgi:hypothetical protein